MKKIFAWFFVVISFFVIVGPKIIYAAVEPTVTTISASSVTQNDAYVGINISNQGSSSLTGRGYCIGTNINYISDCRATGTAPFTTGTYSHKLSALGLTLEPNTTYYYKAYATNNYYGSLHTGYGAVLSFKTLEQTYTLTLNGNGNTGGSMPVQTMTAGTKITLTNAYTKTGYVFSGWSASPNGPVMWLNNAEYTMPSGNAQIYAIWGKMVNLSFSVTGSDAYNYISPGNDGKSVSTGSGSKIPVSVLVSSDKYATISGCGGTETKIYDKVNNAPDSVYEVTVASDCTVTVKFNTATQKVVFNSNGGTGSMSDQTFNRTQSKALISNSFTRVGYYFSGWNTKADGTGASYADKASYTMGSSDVTLYAIWGKMVNISFSVTGSDAFNYINPGKTQSVNVGSTLTIPVVVNSNKSATVSGCDGVEKVITNVYDNEADGEYQVTIKGACTITAVFNSITQKVTFDSTGDYGTMTDQTFDRGETKALKSETFYRPQYYFIRWNTRTDGTGVSYTDGANYTMGNSDATLYAMWGKNPGGNFHISGCEISVGSSTCDSVISRWIVTDEISGANTAITTDYPDRNTSVVGTNTTSGKDKKHTISYGARTFSLYHNGESLADKTVNASCVSGSTWDGNVCALDVSGGVKRISFWPGKVNQHFNIDNGKWETDPDGVSGGWARTQYPNDWGDKPVEYCEKIYGGSFEAVEFYKNETITTWKNRGNVDGPFTATRATYSCLEDVSINEKGSWQYLSDCPTECGYEASTISQTCIGPGDCSGNPAIKSCSATSSCTPAPSGTLTVSNCTISPGSSTCSATISSWSVSKPVTGASTAVTTNYPSSGSTVAGTMATSGSNKTHTIPYGSNFFFLYHNGQKLAESSTTASCASGSTWDGSICKQEGSNIWEFSVLDCIIETGSNQCGIELSWSVKNPNSTTSSKVTTVKSNGDDITVNSYNSGKSIWPISYGAKDFKLWDNNSLLETKTGHARCSNIDIWKDGICVKKPNGEWNEWSPIDTTCDYTYKQTRTCNGTGCVGEKERIVTNICIEGDCPNCPTDCDSCPSSSNKKLPTYKEN